MSLGEGLIIQDQMRSLRGEGCGALGLALLPTIPAFFYQNPLCDLGQIFDSLIS